MENKLGGINNGHTERQRYKREPFKSICRGMPGLAPLRVCCVPGKNQNLQVLYWLFHYTGSQEKEHAEIFYNHLREFHGQEISINADYPIDNTNNILELLQLSAKHEAAEHDTIYKSFGDKAKEEGFSNIANSFYMIAEIEKIHSQRFGQYAQLVQNNKLFENDTPTEYICLNCGHIHKGTSAPQVCPVCSHNQGFFCPPGRFSIWKITKVSQHGQPCLLFFNNHRHRKNAKTPQSIMLMQLWRFSITGAAQNHDW